MLLRFFAALIREARNPRKFCCQGRSSAHSS